MNEDDWKQVAIERAVYVGQARETIRRLREEARILNGVIIRRKRVSARLREFVDAVNELHRPVDGRDLDNTTCRDDGQPWPCRTHHAIESVAWEALPEELKTMLETTLAGKEASRGQ